jgi:hypothetical protein
MPQTGNKDGVIYFGVIERRSLPRQNQRRKSW